MIAKTYYLQYFEGRIHLEIDMIMNVAYSWISGSKFTDNSTKQFSQL
jgi:hypothetical protein